MGRQPQERQEFHTYQRLEVRSRRVSACREGNKLRQEVTCLASDHRPQPIPVDKGWTRKGPCLVQCWTYLLTAFRLLPAVGSCWLSVSSSQSWTLPPFQFYHLEQTERPSRAPTSLQLSVRTKLGHQRTLPPPWYQPLCPIPMATCPPRASLTVCLAILLERVLLTHTQHPEEGRLALTPEGRFAGNP